MTGAITWEQAGFFAAALVGLFGIVGWLYTRFEAKFRQIDKRADGYAEALSAYKLHVAENFVSKAGLREFRDEVMSGVREIKQSVTHLNDRIDSILTSAPSPRRPAAK